MSDVTAPLTDESTDAVDDDAAGLPVSHAGSRRTLTLTALTTGTVVAPLLLAALVLAFRPWYPTLDMAMTELRVRDVGGRQTPLIGLPGRIGDFPDQGSHPGPWSFWLMRPFHLLSGGRSWGLELGSALVNAIAAGVALWIADRIGGRRLQLAVAGVVAIAVLGYGLSVLTHPWNPYFPLLLWIVVMLATWAVRCGDHRLAIVVVVVGTIAAQTHVPYLLLAITMSALTIGTLIVRREVGVLAATVGAAALMWLPAAVDQLRREPGNISMLIDHFTGDTDEATIGIVSGGGVFLRHLDLPGAGVEMVRGDAAFLEVSGNTGGLAVGGLVVFLLWIGAAVVAWRRRHTVLTNLNIVVALAMAVGWFSMTRIFGKIWYYLTLWAWGTALLAALSIAWTAGLLLSDTLAGKSGEPDPLGSGVPRASWSIVLVATLASMFGAIRLDVPEENLSSGLGAVTDATEAAVRAGDGDAVGPSGRYVVFWQDVNFIGAQGYGLVNELERRGLNVGVHATWRVPVTPQRVFPQGTYDAEIHLVSGAFIDEWRTRPGYIEVIEADPRSAAETMEFDEIRTRVLGRFEALGREDLIDIVDVNLFGTSLDPDLPDDVIDDLARMLVLTTPVAVFIAPAGSTF